jgi:hypothetical protein
MHSDIVVLLPSKRNNVLNLKESDLMVCQQFEEFRNL